MIGSVHGRMRRKLTGFQITWTRLCEMEHTSQDSLLQSLGNNGKTIRMVAAGAVGDVPGDELRRRQILRGIHR